ncbi:MAG: sulfotransferase domain-containing protein [Bacteroidetes bacterium]|nr:sulfotransferase domain-containing protein [Bacteroidota bacterium]
MTKKPRKYLLISPREPSGATWLINCFLELGIKTYRRQDPDWMWQKQEDGSCVLNPEENILRKWLPILSAEKVFLFKDDIEVQWTHEWPVKGYSSLPVIYFIRDPRDSIYSRYKRESPKISFADFLDIPDAATLLHKIDNWVLFNLYWLQRKNLKVFRFEDYKNDANNTLNSILEYIKFVPDPDKFKKAIDGSTSDKARESENEYRKINNSDSQVINRAGAVSEWKKILDREDKKVIDKIEIKSEKLLTYFGYEVRGLVSVEKDIVIYPNVSILPFFSQIEFSPEDVFQNENKRSSTLSYLSVFTKTINKKWLNECGMLPFEIDILLNNLLVFFQLIQDKKKYDKILLLKSKHNQTEDKNSITLNLKRYVHSVVKKIIKKINP